MAIVRNGLIAVFIVIMCYYVFKTRDAMAVFKNFSPVFQVSSSSRVCLDPSEPDYFQALSKSTGVNASKKHEMATTLFKRRFTHRAGGLDIGEFSFFVSDVAGRLTETKATRRGILALRSFKPGETLMSTSLDSMFSMDQIHRSKMSTFVPIFREIGMNDMAILIVTLM
jgi:hypothetical protein